MLGVDLEQLTVGGDDVGAEERVDREAVLAHEVADAAAERDATDADGAGIAEADGEALLCGGARDFGRGEAGLRVGRALDRVDLEPLHLAEVENHATFGHAVPCAAVAAAAHRKLDAGGACHPHDVLDVRRIGDEGNRGRSAIDVACHHRAEGVVVRSTGKDQAAAQATLQLFDEGGDRWGRRHRAPRGSVGESVLHSPYRPVRDEELIGPRTSATCRHRCLPAINRGRR